MLRVFKVTSPMSVGSWLLVASSGATVSAALLEALGKLRRGKLAAEAVSTLCGAPLTTYTGTLIADTAIPVWHEARRELPFLFGASGLASAGAAATMLLDPEEAGPARRLAVGAAVAENAIMAAMEARLGFLGEPYRKGQPGLFNWIAKAASLGGAALLARSGRRSRGAAALGGALVLAGEVAMRWSVFKAGFASARDPKYTVRPQRVRQRV
jgi:hypothetical protein